MPNFSYDSDNHTWFSDGAPMMGDQIRSILARIIEENSSDVSVLVRHLLSGELSPQTFENQMRLTIKDAYIQSYLLGIGGRSRMTPSDWGRIGASLRTQYGFLSNFVGSYDTSTMSPEIRAQLYIESASQSYWRAVSRDYEVVLPAYPGDLSTECGSRCGCRWMIDERETYVRAYWILGATEHCRTCESRSVEWSPIVVNKI